MNAKNAARKSLQIFRKTSLEGDRLTFIQNKRTYRQLIRECKKKHKQNLAEKLHRTISEPKAFWKELRTNLGFSKNRSIGNIKEDEWVTHFKKVFSSEHSQPQHVDRDAEAPLDDEVMERLNRDITEDEVKKAIRKLKNQKASGYDCVMPEMLKLSGNTAVPFLTRCFNKVFTDGTYPEEWTRAVIIPLHKKGDLENPDNYRGISLLSVISKCYTCVLNTRMKEWMEENEKIIEVQAGFRHG